MICMLERDIQNFLKLYEDLRPKSNRNLDQFYATYETVARRLELMAAIDDLSDKKVLFLGDDDLISVCLAKYLVVKKIVVVDIDKRILDFLNMIARNENLAVDFYYHDLIRPLPKKEFCDFDVVFFDPPYTPAAVDVWLTRAMEASMGKGKNKLRKSTKFLKRKEYFLCYGYTNDSLERGLKIQEIISQKGLVIQEKRRDFNNYTGAKSLGSKSDLYWLKPTAKLNIGKIDSARSKFYTGWRADS